MSLLLLQSVEPIGKIFEPTARDSAGPPPLAGKIIW